ncbi:hypothetical protein B0H19DRAFT_1243089 [Mycena capillaripes]|nr:hypothetical protein B0H19DRAFT_1243089 [Mycena capillaripes]
MSEWCAVTDGSDECRPYSYYFSLPRHPPPNDLTPPSAMTTKHRGESLPNTTQLRRLDLRALTCPVSETVDLALDFVADALSKYGPKLDSDRARLDWQWDDRPNGVEDDADGEQDLYPYLDWVLYKPAAHALPAVLHHLFAQKSNSMPEWLPKHSTTSIIRTQNEYGSTDIVQFWTERPRGHYTSGNVRTVHEVKRARVLAADDSGVNVLDAMYSLADSTWDFRRGKECSRGSSLLFQAINELAKYGVKHIVLTTETRYTLIQLSDDHQLYMSHVYHIHGSRDQAGDMAELVLFYAHATFAKPLELPPRPVTICRVTVPSFSPAVFQPHQGFIRVGNVIRSVKLSAPQHSSGRVFPPFIPLRVEGYAEQIRHDGQVRITFIRLRFLLFEASAVAKAAYGHCASNRLNHEFDAYNALRSLQGISIPTLFGLYHDNCDGSSVLITSDEGTPLDGFDKLSLRDRHTLLSHLIRIHSAGVQHNDMEPRNVVLSPSLGPIIIDFDVASLDHRCDGLYCCELRELAGCLGLNLDVELSTTKCITVLKTKRIAAPEWITMFLIMLFAMLLVSVESLLNLWS